MTQGLSRPGTWSWLGIGASNLWLARRVEPLVMDSVLARRDSIAQRRFRAGTAKSTRTKSQRLPQARLATNIVVSRETVSLPGSGASGPTYATLPARYPPISCFLTMSFSRSCTWGEKSPPAWPSRPLAQPHLRDVEFKTTKTLSGNGSMVQTQ